MEDKSIIYICVFIGSTLGSLLSSLWGGGFFSISGVVFGAVGGFIGLYIAYKIM